MKDFIASSMQHLFFPILPEGRIHGSRLSAMLLFFSSKGKSELKLKHYAIIHVMLCTLPFIIIIIGLTFPQAS